LNLLKFNKVFVQSIKISGIKAFMTLRIRGIESVLKKRGPLGYLINLTSNFADITDSEFSFSELTFQNVQESWEILTESLVNHYTQEAMQ
jgi:hypothetical protein